MTNGKPTTAQVLPLPQTGGDFRDIADCAPVGMALLGADGTVMYANPALSALLGYGPEEMTALPVERLMPADTISAAHVDFQRLLAGKTESLSCQCQYRRKNGALIWVLLSAVLRHGAARAARQIVLQLTDIDALKKTEEELIYNEQRWSNALAAGGQGVWDHDRRTDRTFHNVSWHTMRGYAPGEGVADGPEEWLSRIHPDDRERIVNNFRKQDRGEDGYDTLEYRERRKDGGYVWIYSRGRPIEWSADGTPLRTVGTDTDITERKVMEAQLAEEKERLRVTLQSISEGVISTDAQARIIFINGIAEKMTGWRATEAIGRPVSEVFYSRPESGDTGSEAVQAVENCLKTGDIFRPDGYSLMIGRRGVRRYVRESAAPVRTTTGEIIGAVMVFQDTTVHRKMQQELAYSATHDSLTRLPNRMAFDTRLEEMLAAAQNRKKRNGVSALCLIDLDYFKQVNDGSGHTAGDALLKEVANRIKASCRHSDFAARIGGDEFAVILEDCDARNAEKIAGKIVEAISGLAFEWDDRAYHIGASIGVTEITPDNASAGADAHYRRADAACYAAKAEGRNRVAIR